MFPVFVVNYCRFPHNDYLCVYMFSLLLKLFPQNKLWGEGLLSQRTSSFLALESRTLSKKAVPTHPAASNVWVSPAPQPRCFQRWSYFKFNDVMGFKWQLVFINLHFSIHSISLLRAPKFILHLLPVPDFIALCPSPPLLPIWSPNERVVVGAGHSSLFVWEPPQ